MAVLSSSWWLDIIAVGIALLSLLYLYFKVSYSYWKRRGVPYLEPSLPFGNIQDILLFKKTTGEVYAELYNRLPNEKLVGFYLVCRPALVIRDLDTIKNFLVKDFGNFHDRGLYINEEIDPLGAHLFFLAGERWRSLRSKLTPTYTSGKIKNMFHTVLDCAEELKIFLKEPAHLEEVIEVKDVLARFTTDVIASCAFGIQCNCLKDPDAEFRKFGLKFFNPNFLNRIGWILNSMTPSLSSYLKIRTVSTEVNNFFSRIVSETIGYREKNNVERNDFMQLLIRLKNTGSVEGDDGEGTIKTPVEGGQTITMTDITGNAFVFFIAGFETSSTTMSFCLYELACNPAVQDRLRREIDAAVERGGVTYDTMQEMKYLDKVIAETLRKYPPVPILNRECTKQYRMPESEIVIEPGVAVIIPVLALHHDPRYYPEPEVFDPERFSDEAKAKRPHFAYMPFGEGPRVCIGQRFGLMQTKVGLITLLSNFQFNMSDKTPVPLVMDPKSFILTPPEGIFLQVTRRTDYT